jgi:hypothetical protein
MQGERRSQHRSQRAWQWFLDQAIASHTSLFLYTSLGACWGAPAVLAGLVRIQAAITTGHAALAGIHDTPEHTDSEAAVVFDLLDLAPSRACAPLLVPHSAKGAASEDPQSTTLACLPHCTRPVLRLPLEHTRSACHAQGLGCIIGRCIRQGPLDVCSKSLDQRHHAWLPRFQRPPPPGAQRMPRVLVTRICTCLSTYVAHPAWCAPATLAT